MMVNVAELVFNPLIFPLVPKSMVSMVQVGVRLEIHFEFGVNVVL